MSLPGLPWGLHPPCPGPSSPSLAQPGALMPAGTILSVRLIPVKWWMGLSRWVSDPCCRCPPLPRPPGWTLDLPHQYTWSGAVDGPVPSRWLCWGAAGSLSCSSLVSTVQCLAKLTSSSPVGAFCKAPSR